MSLLFCLESDSEYIGSVLPLAEKALIDRIRRQAGAGRRKDILTGIGDDCALLDLPERHETLVTTDFSLEGIHFQRAWHPPESVGHRCLTRGLSDIAAMGGEPIAAFLSLALPRRLPQSWVDRFMTGLLKLAKEFGVVLTGGDTAQSPGGVLADIMVIGSVPRGKAILRSGAKPGDRIFVTGELGGSAGALDELLSGNKKKLRTKDYPKFFFPTPRLEVGRILRERGIASAMIDLSDGLSSDLAQICRESGVGAELKAEAIPLAKVGRRDRQVDIGFALHGGEDYELLFTVKPDEHPPREVAGVPLTDVGRIRRGSKMWISKNSIIHELVPQGWEHFRN